MPISIVLPLFYLFIGLLLGRAPIDLKKPASAAMTVCIIPFVVIFNVATHRPGVFPIMFGTIAVMSAMLAASRLFTKDPVENLCFCYLNIGWLGLPVAAALFGEEAAAVYIAAYVGNSLFGNSFGVGLMAHGESLRARALRTARSPPVFALTIGLCLIPFADQVARYASQLYVAARFLTGFLGMAILGMWLSQTKLRARDLVAAAPALMRRFATASALMTVFLVICRLGGVTLASDNAPALYMIGLLPPAANIVVLETHYLNSGRSAALIASGTLVSLLAIALYAAATLWLRG